MTVKKKSTRAKSPPAPLGVRSKISKTARRELRDLFSRNQIQNMARVGGVPTKKKDTKGDLSHRLGANSTWANIVKTMAAIGFGAGGTALVYMLTNAGQSFNATDISEFVGVLIENREETKPMTATETATKATANAAAKTVARKVIALALKKGLSKSQAAIVGIGAAVQRKDENGTDGLATMVGTAMVVAMEQGLKDLPDVVMDAVMKVYQNSYDKALHDALEKQVPELKAKAAGSVAGANSGVIAAETLVKAFVVAKKGLAGVVDVDTVLQVALKAALKAATDGISNKLSQEQVKNAATAAGAKAVTALVETVSKVVTLAKEKGVREEAVPHIVQQVLRTAMDAESYARSKNFTLTQSQSRAAGVAAGLLLANTLINQESQDSHQSSGRHKLQRNNTYGQNDNDIDMGL